VSPHPTPNSAAPMTSGASIVTFSGHRLRGANNGVRGRAMA
jgi:hypothetical protein